MKQELRKINMYFMIDLKKAKKYIYSRQEKSGNKRLKA